MKLVIVESPTKAKTLSKFLGDEYVVESSLGHIRDLPDRNHPVPEKLKKEPWAKLGVNIEKNFEPLYIVSPDKKKHIAELKRLLKEADELLLATDEDREGEAISWHLIDELKPKPDEVEVKRMVFHEITKTAVLEALEQTRGLNEDLVAAQEARRIIDRLYGYKISPLLWKKIGRQNLSAGRVQSVALRMVVEREQERMRFVSANYWDMKATLHDATDANTSASTFEATLRELGGARLASSRDFDAETGQLRNTERVHLDEARARALVESLDGVPWVVAAVEEKGFTEKPKAPFTTSTLQQEANRKLSYDARRTMAAAQVLYENGLITYMRTDSVTLAAAAVEQIRGEITSLYGAELLPESPNTYSTKVKNAQEAHEAIRPAGETFRTIEEVQKMRLGRGNDAARVYELIWKRAIACQMIPARGLRLKVQIEGTPNAGPFAGQTALVQATGKTYTERGHLLAYVEGSDDPEAALAGRDTILPPLAEGQTLAATALEALGHDTSPPARFTEASLVKLLEERGIGRPSTYASILSKIQQHYIFKKGNALVPNFTAFAVVTLMRDHFAHLIDYDFTAAMEERLDEISNGKAEETQPYLEQFYFGNGVRGLKELVERNEEEIDPAVVCRISVRHAPPDSPVAVRVMRRATMVVREDLSSTSANFLAMAPIPEETCPDELDMDKALELLEAQARAEEPIGAHPETGENVYIKRGQWGPYVQLGETPERGAKKSEQPKRVKLLKGQTRDDVDLQTAVKLLSLPRLLGVDADGEEIHACTGRYGPYIKRGKDTRSLTDTDDVLEVGLERALELLAQEKRRGRQSAEPIKVFEAVEALEGADIKLLAGRYGPYVTDGEVNASLPRDADPDELTVEDAIELLERKRASPGRKKKKKKKKKAKKKKTKKKAAKKKTKKKAAKKKTKKKAAKKTKQQAAEPATED